MHSHRFAILPVFLLLLVEMIFSAGVTISEGLIEPIPVESYASLDDDQARANIFPDPNWFNWGASVLKDTDGKYHMFYSRWPKKYGFLSWLTHSEIAHAVADNPDGPYHYVETALSCRGDNQWDKITAHNPKIKKFDGKYYLYYCGTHADLTEDELIQTARGGYRHKNWKPLRENQRTGVAVADKITGPWKRSKMPIIEPAGPIKTLTVNPAITQGPDGRYFMMIKGDKPGTTKFVRNQAIATSKSPASPFEIYPKAAISTFDTEDASMWYDKKRKKFYATFHAHKYIGLISSQDGYNWQKATPDRITNKQILFADGQIFKPDRMERPFVLLDEKGQPQMLFVSVRKGNKTMNLHLPFGWSSQ